MFRASSFAMLLGTLGLGACVVPQPAGPSVLVVPPEGKNLAQFQHEDINCRGYALQQIGYGSPQQAANGNAVGSAAIGASAGAALGAAAGGAGAGAAIGAGTGLLAGSAVGATTAQASAVAQQQNYDIAYAQCMAASGDQVQAFPVAWPYGPYGYPYAYPAFFDPWFGPVATLGFFGTVGPGFRHRFFRSGDFHHGFHRG